MSESKTEQEAEKSLPLGQRLLDSPFLLLAAGMLVMFVFYTLWGLIEIASLPQGKLP